MAPPRLTRPIVLIAATVVMALAPAAGAVGPTVARPADSPGTFRLLVGADRAGSAWGNRWVGVVDEWVSWLGAAFRVDAARLVAPPARVTLQKRHPIR